MTKTKGIIYGSLILLALSVLYFGLHKRDAGIDKQIGSTVLPSSDKAEVIIDAPHHRITTVKRDGGKVTTERKYLSSAAKIEVTNSGELHITQRAWGTELVPEIGLSYSDKLRLVGGVGVFYVQRFELLPMFALGLSGKVDGRLGIAVSYNVYNNTHLFVGMQANGGITGGLTLTF